MLAGHKSSLLLLKGQEILHLIINKIWYNKKIEIKSKYTYLLKRLIFIKLGKSMMVIWDVQHWTFALSDECDKARKRPVLKTRI